jgi:hypothetical protein
MRISSWLSMPAARQITPSSLPNTTFSAWNALSAYLTSSAVRRLQRTCGASMPVYSEATSEAVSSSEAPITVRGGRP